MQRSASFPNSSFGVWRGGGDTQTGGSGSGMGQSTQGTGLLSQGIGAVSGGGSWEPTILYLFALVIAEMIAFHVLGRMLK
jgi:hypothetical protein